MPGKNLAMAGLFAASAALLLGGAPSALAQDCDPQASICQGVSENTAPPSASPPVTASEDQYPFDDEWYFNPAGGGTELQPNHPANGGETGRH
jgi:hypothetical protein